MPARQRLINPYWSLKRASLRDFEALETRLLLSVDPSWFGVIAPSSETGLAQLTADVNGNGTVDFSDFLILAENFSSEVNGGAVEGDFDFDGTVSLRDFLLLAADFGKSDGSATIQFDGQETRTVEDQWIVELSDAAITELASLHSAASELRTQGIIGLSGLGEVGSLLVETPGLGPSAVDLFEDSPLISSYSPNELFELTTTTNDPLIRAQWGLHQTSTPDAWESTTGRDSVVIGVVDTGIDYTHPDIAGNMWRNPGEIPDNGIDDDQNGFVDDVHGVDFLNLLNGDTDPMDDNGHGTHVAGIIGAVGNNSEGMSGVAQDVSLMALKICERFCSSASATAALNYATMMKGQGENIVATNNSWGGIGITPDPLASAIDNNGDVDILFVAAAGNENQDAATFWPANYEASNVISVGATNSGDFRATGWFGGQASNYGETVDIGAPGNEILSAWTGERYRFASGTSMAAPHVTGVIALASAFKPHATAAQLKHAIIQGADRVDSLVGEFVGGRRLNSPNTLKELSADNATLIHAGRCGHNNLGSYLFVDNSNDAPVEAKLLIRYTRFAVGGFPIYPVEGSFMRTVQLDAYSELALGCTVTDVTTFQGTRVFTTYVHSVVDTNWQV